MFDGGICGDNNSSEVRCAEVTFTATGAGTYTGSVSVPAGSTLLDIQVQSPALWDSAMEYSLLF